MVELGDIDDNERIKIWVLGRLDQMAEEGLIERSGNGLTPAGTALYDQLCMEYTPRIGLVMECLLYFDFFEPELVPAIARCLYMSPEERAKCFIDKKPPLWKRIIKFIFLRII